MAPLTLTLTRGGIHFLHSGVGFLFWLFWLRKPPSLNLVCLNIFFLNGPSSGQIFPTKLTLVTEKINRSLTTASNPLRIHDMNQKYSSHPRRGKRKFSEAEKRLREERSTRHQCAPSDAWCSTERFPSRRAVPLLRAAPPETAGAVSPPVCDSIFHPVLARGLATDRYGKHQNDCAVQSHWESEWEGKKCKK